MARPRPDAPPETMKVLSLMCMVVLTRKARLRLTFRRLKVECGNGSTDSVLDEIQMLRSVLYSQVSSDIHRSQILSGLVV